MFILQEEIDAEVKNLLSLKAQYKELTGEDPTPAPASSGKKDKSAKQETKPDSKKANEKKQSKPKDGEGEQKKKEEQQSPKEADSKCGQKDATCESASAEAAASRELKKVTR